MPNMDRIYTIIVTYNAMQWIARSLCSCEQPERVIVVDNNSSDTTTSFIKETFPQVILLPQHENLGFGAANNIGIAYALAQGASHVFLMNQDVYIEPHTISNLLAVQEERPSFGVVSPIHLNGSGEALDAMFGSYAMANSALFVAALRKASEVKKIYKVPFVNAAAWLVSKACLETVGGFDPYFFHYGEDENYCQRLKYHGFEIGISPTAFVQHDRPQQMKRKKKLFSDRYFHAYKKLMGLKYANVNNPLAPNFLASEKRKIKQRILKERLKLNVAGVKGYQKQLQLLMDIEQGIVDSWNTNREQGPHYLNK